MTCSRQPNPIWLLDDLVGNILDDTYYVHFKSNIFPYIPQAVYHESTCTNPWENPLQVQADGTLPVDLYFNEDQVYRIEIRQGPLNSDPLIRLIENYVPIKSGGVEPTSVNINGDNQITNGQFQEIYFSDDNDYVISNNGDNYYTIAPGWLLRLTSGSAVNATLTRTAIAGTTADDIDGNPTYTLNIITSVGMTRAELIQRFTGTASIWTGVGVTSSVVAQSNDGVERPLSTLYRPSSPASADITISSGTLNTGSLETIDGAVLITTRNNSQSPPTAYVDFVIELPPVGDVSITNIQLVPEYVTDEDLLVTLPYNQDTPQRQRDYMFNVYADSLLTKPKDNILVGWNFALNPYQFRSPTLADVTTQVQYIADQTIIRQNSGSAVQAGRAASNLNRGLGLQIKAKNGAANNIFALIQYIDPKTILPYWDNHVSCLVRAAITRPLGSPNAVPIKMRLIWRDSLPPTIGAAEPITALNGGDPSFAVGWEVLIPDNDPEYDLQLYNSGTEDQYPAYKFERFLLPEYDPAAATITNKMLGIVVYTTAQLDATAGDEEYIIFDQISLIPGPFAADAAPETYEQTLSKCQFYYESSYDTAVQPGTALAYNGTILKEQFAASGAPQNLISRLFTIPFKTAKRSSSTTTPNDLKVTIYSPVSGTSDRVSASINDGSAADPNKEDPAPTDVSVSLNWVQSWPNAAPLSRQGVKQVSFLPINVNSLHTRVGVPDTSEPYIEFHYTADARMALTK